MATERQIESNRLNALRSTGPRTELGKSISRRNAVRHGLTAQLVIMEGENPAELEQFRAEIVEEFAPVGRVEGELVDRLVGLLWRLRRAPQFEAAAYAWMQCLQSAAHDDEDGSEQALRSFVGLSRALPPLVERGDSRTTKDRQLHIGRMLEAMNHKDLLSKLARHEANLMNQVNRTLKQLHELMEHRMLTDAAKASPSTQT